MALGGSIVAPQQRPNAAQPTPGVPGSRATFFLRSAPRPFTVLIAGGSNETFLVRGVPNDTSSVPLPRRARVIRVTEGALKTGQASLGIAFNVSTAGSNLSSGASVSLPITFEAFTRGTRTTRGSISLGITFAVNSRPSGGLTLTPEVQVSETLTAETSDSHTLTAEVASSLTLTPEQ